MAILLSLPSNPTLSYNRLSSFSSSADDLSLSLSSLSLRRSITPQTLTIRMGGGPRTYPGGVNKWQWKRMQKKKATQLLKARLMRERQIYEMRKRAELKAAVSELERPWEVVEQAAPNLFSVRADEQLKVLADRFQKPGGFDLWTERDGPQLFETPDGLPTSRFFPKGVVHSIKPYGRVDSDDQLGPIEDPIDEIEQESSNSESLNSRVSTGHRKLDRKRNGGQRAQPNKNKPYGRVDSDDKLGPIEDQIDDIEQESSNSDPLNSRVSSGHRKLDRKRNGGSQRGQNRIASRVRSRSSDDSRVFRSGDRAEREEMKMGKIVAGNRRDGAPRRSGNGAIKLPNWRQSASSSGERRNSSGAGGRIDGGKMQKRRNSSTEGELYELSLQRDGSYSLGSMAEK